MTVLNTKKKIDSEIRKAIEEALVPARKELCEAKDTLREKKKLHEQ